MRDELLVGELNRILDDIGIFKALSVHNVNHDPHPFTVGPRHVKHAADHCGGMLGEKTLEVIECAHPKCGLLYKDHKSEKVAFLQLQRNAKNQEANSELLKIKQFMIDHRIDGIAMVETEQEFRIT